MNAISSPLFRFLFCETVAHDMSFLVAVAALGIFEATLFHRMGRFTASETGFVSVKSRFPLPLLRCLLMRGHVVYDTTGVAMRR